MNSPYGGKLINKLVHKVSEHYKNKKSIVISKENELDFYNISDGTFSPLEGFMGKKEFINVLNDNRLLNGSIWTVPIVLDITEEQYDFIKREDVVGLKILSGKIIGYIEVEDIYKHDKNLHIKKLFGTNSRKHPGVSFIYSDRGNLLIHGNIMSITKTCCNPREIRKVFKKKSWRTICGFQTRNIPHRAHEYLQRLAMEYVDGVFIQPIEGWKKPGDFSINSIKKCYRALIKNYYPSNRVYFSTLKTAMRYAGPKEAIFHSIIRKNFGCTHFVIGRDHAGVGEFYKKYEAHELVEKYDEELGIVLLKYAGPFYSKFGDIIATERTYRYRPNDIVEISGTLIREIIRKGGKPSEKILRPEVFEVLTELKENNKLFY